MHSPLPSVSPLPLPLPQSPDHPAPFSSTRGFRYALLFALAMTEMLPVALLSTAMPVLLRRSGASMKQMGILSLIMFPWAIKALWAPLVDKWGARSRFGRYRAWLFVTHPLLLITLLLGAFVDIPSLFIGSQAVGLPALLWLSFISATADTASHGLAVNLLSAEERGMGNGIQSAGMMVGSVIGGGLMVMLVGRLGWQMTLFSMAALILLPLFGVALYQEPPLTTQRTVTLRETLALFGRPRIWSYLGVLVVISSVPTMAWVPFQAAFVDRGLDLTEIGLLIGIVGSTAGALGGILGGVTVAQLGRQRAFYALNILGVFCLAITALLLTHAAPSRAMLHAAIIADSFGLAARGTIMCVMMMDRSRGHLASTDYTVQYSLTQFCGFLGMGVGGYIADRIGGTPILLSVPVFMLGVIVISPWVLRREDFQATPASLPHA